MRGRMAIPALASSTTSDKSFTKKYKTHKIVTGRGQSKTYYNFVFNDIMGLEKGGGVHAEEIKLALNRHVKEGYKFNPASHLTTKDPGYNPSPPTDDRVHVLTKMAEIREVASDIAMA
ncbi:interferon-induced protein 44-like [Etheostoma cragini]|uniref:interferon-induced protein 44-like n=1 Tax=Etheostoma cragini TaxID=417921 RepID=UPI00155F03C2|nr:interferon-induced protein 44-like [Etheostoma cragini]